MSDTSTVWLGYCSQCQTYRTGEQSGALTEWTEHKNLARLFASAGYALNSARCYSRTHLVDGEWTDHREFVEVIELQVDTAKLQHFLRGKKLLRHTSLEKLA